MVKKERHDDILLFLKELLAFDGTPSDYLKLLIRTKIQAVSAQNGVILKRDESGNLGLVASYPELTDTKESPSWIQQIFSKASSFLETETVQRIHIGNLPDGRQQYLLALPLDSNACKNGTEVYTLIVKQGHELQQKLSTLQVLLPYYSYYQTRVRESRYREKTERLYRAFEVMTSLQSALDYPVATLALCNQVASRWSCSRVSFGEYSGQEIQYRALSNADKFNHKTTIIRDLVGAMEECADQNLEIIYPQQGDGLCVCRCARKFSSAHGSLSIVSIPLRYKGEVFGVLTLERGEDRPFLEDEIETFRLLLDLYSPQLYSLKWIDRGLAQKSKDTIHDLSAKVLGARYTWAKLAVLLVVILSIWLSFQKVMYKVESTFVFEPKTARILSAPFSGKIVEILVENGQQVEQGELLFKMDTTEMELQLKQLQAERVKLLKEVTVALRENKPAEEQIARSQLKGNEAESNLVQYSLENALVKATMTGTVVGNDLGKRTFSVVSLGEEVLQIIDSKKIEPSLYIPESQVVDLEVGQIGELATTGYPDRKIPFKVVTIERNARLVSQKNVFRAKAKITAVDPAQHEWIHSGMEGVALVDVEPRLMVWVYGRKAINWVRMYFWI